jgi:hypothetical protein
LHSTDYGRYATTEAGRQAFATDRLSGRRRVQKSESEFRDGRRSKGATKRTTNGESVRNDGRPWSVDKPHTSPRGPRRCWPNAGDAARQIALAFSPVLNVNPNRKITSDNDVH